MDSRDLHNLSEAWNNITSSQQINEGPAGSGYGSGIIGQVQRLGAKMFGDASAVNKAVSYERSIDALTKSRGGGNVALGADGKPITAAQIDAETRRRRLADPNYKPGQGVDSGAPVRLGNGGGGGGGGGNVRPSAPVLSPQQIANQKANAQYQALRTKDPAAAKAKGMEIFAKANPQLAAAAAERARIRGTAQTDNPLMRDMRSRLPQVTPSIQAPAVAKLGAGNQSLVQNPNAIRGAAPRPVAPVAATAPITNRVATAYGSGAKPIVPIRPIPAVRPLATPRPVATTALRPGLRLQHTDLFDIVKGHLMNEGATEEEALKKMVNMTQEERNAILGEKNEVL